MENFEKQFLYCMYAIAALLVIVMFAGITIYFDNHIAKLQKEVAALQQFKRGSDVYHMEYGKGVKWQEATNFGYPKKDKD
ncbi:MAG: hypothetical protein KAR20_28300 [Candidatus Heimdallarchaeota archaeon]|nr:hypothetical protein [Candidatus Heimdallarchaeota archaeon]